MIGEIWDSKGIENYRTFIKKCGIRNNNISILLDPKK